MSVSLTVTCPKCDELISCDVDIEVSGVERTETAILLDVVPNITDESLARITAHTATH